MVVHALRVKGFVDAEAVVAATGLDAVEVDVLLAGLAGAGHARHREGRISGWMLTPEGRAHGESLLAAELEAFLRDQDQRVDREGGLANEAADEDEAADPDED